MMRLTSKKLINTAMRPHNVRLFSSAVAERKVTAAPTLGSAPQKDQSILQRLFNPSSMPSVPLDQVFPDLPPLKDASALATDVQITEITSGPCKGMRVASSPSNSGVAQIGVFVDVGSRYESQDLNGISHFLELMAFKSTMNRSEFRLIREMGKIGANINVQSSREHMFYSGEVLAQYAPELLGTFADVIQRNLWNEEEFAQAKELYLESNQERSQTTEMVIMDAIHTAAYGKRGLGLSIYGPDHNVKKFHPQMLRAWRDAYFTRPKMVVAAVGVDHAQLVESTEELFSSQEETMSGFEPEGSISSEYVGGEIRIDQPTNDGLAHFAVAYETASWHDSDLVPMCVLNMMMGGGGSFSAGGPGKGMYSRLYQNVLNQYGFVERANCFNSIFSDTSLFGIYATAEPGYGENLVEIVAAEMNKMTGTVDPQELSRAKNGLKSQVHILMESNANRMEDFGRQLVTYGKVQTPEETCAAVDSVTAVDIVRVAEKMLETSPSFVTMGVNHNIPRFTQLERIFKR